MMMNSSAGVDDARMVHNCLREVVVLWGADQAVYGVSHDQGRVGRLWARHLHRM